jgi:DNA-binding transcriptional MerR regulator
MPELRPMREDRLIEDVDALDEGERRGQKSDSAYRTISEVADDLRLPQHVLRFWESKFRQINPMKRAGGRRFYRPQDIDLIKRIHYLLYTQGYTIKGVQKLLVKDRHLAQSVPNFTGETAIVDVSDALQRSESVAVVARSVDNIEVPVSRPIATMNDPQRQAELKYLLDRIKELRSRLPQS